MMDTSSLFRAVKERSERHEANKLRFQFLQDDSKQKQEKKEAIINHTALLEKVRVFLQELAEATRDEITKGLQDVVTLCLQSVFGPDIRFEIEVGTLRNHTSIEFYVVSEEGEHSVKLKPEDSMGGGVIDTISIGLRFGLLKILNPTPIGPVILDEPAKMVSSDRIESIGLLIKDLSVIFGKQVIMVTHHASLADIADHSVWIQKERGVSSVK